MEPADGGEAVLEAFRRLGIEYLISSPGSDWPPLWEALARQKVKKRKGPHYVNCWHETVAIAMAMGYAAVTDRPQAVVLHTGVGLLQGALAIRSAYHDEIPILLCVGESASLGEDPELDMGSHWLKDLSDVGGPSRLVEPFAKWSSSVKDPATLHNLVRRAGEIARRTPKGPAVLSIPIEMMYKPWAAPSRAERSPSSLGTSPNREAVEKLTDILLDSKSPVVLTDSAGRSLDGFDMLVQLSEILAIPVVESRPPRYANFPTDHPLYLGMDARQVMNSDLFLILASRGPWYPLTSVPKAGATVVVVDSNPIRTSMPYQVLQADLLIEADPVATLRCLLNELKSREVGTARVAVRRKFWSAEHAKLERRLSERVAEARTKKPTDPVYLCHMISKVMPKGTAYVEETIVHGDVIREHVGRSEPQTYFRPGGGGLGLGLGMALGVKLALPRKTVVCLIGDGAFLYNPVVQALGAAKENHLPIMIVVFNNMGYASMKRAHIRGYPQGVAVKSGFFFGVEIPGPDYSEFVKPFGGYGERVENPEMLEGALRRAADAVNEGRTSLLNVLLST